MRLFQGGAKDIGEAELAPEAVEQPGRTDGQGAVEFGDDGIQCVGSVAELFEAVAQSAFGGLNRVNPPKVGNDSLATDALFIPVGFCEFGVAPSPGLGYLDEHVHTLPAYGVAVNDLQKMYCPYKDFWKTPPILT